MSPIILLQLQLTVIALAFVGGVFLGFSDFILRSLARTSGSGGVEAMQSINREVFHWVFMALFLGLVPVVLLVAGYGGLILGQSAGLLLALAGVVSVIGCFGVTALHNVPMNKALADMVYARIVTESWRHHCNTKFPHSSLGYRPLAPEVISWLASPSGAASPAAPAVPPRPVMHQD